MFTIVKDKPIPGVIEFAEKKGRGHPDSLADALAEVISYEYSRYCMAEFGVIPHHHVDKLGILGGQARVEPGRYEQVSPFRILLNGRFSHSFGGTAIPVSEIANQAVREYLPLVLPQVRDTHWTIIDNTDFGTGSSAKGWHWWAPRDRDDLPELRLRRSNDTSVSIAMAPYSGIEESLLEADEALFRTLVLGGQCGSDTKILASRVADTLSVTACVPVLASAAASRDRYDSIKAEAGQILQDVFARTPGIASAEIAVNTRDDVAAGDLYLLGLGTAAEHGDQGAVGRGNRMNGLIATEAPASMEAPWGKNPVYFTGLIYDACARAVSHSVHDSLDVPNITYVASQNGREIADPWRAVIRVPSCSDADPRAIEKSAEEAFQQARTVGALLDGIRERYPHLPRIALP